jgi:anti-anti-sigma factor
MDTKLSKRGDIVVAAVGGKLDVATAPQLEARLGEVLDDGSTKLVLDLARLEYLSSAGIRVFLVTMKKLKEAGGQVHFAALTPEVRRVFDITGSSFRVPLFATVDEAVKAFA